MQHLFLSLDLNEADSLPLPLYIHSSQKFTQLGSNPISLKCINPHIIRRTWLSQGVLYIKALKYVVKPQQWCTCGTTELWPILTVKQVHELQLWYIQCAALFRLSFLMSPEFQRMYYHASPVGKKTQQLYLDALANTSLCQSRHLPCYHISFPKTQFYTAISSSVFLQNHSTVEDRRNLWALLLQTLVKQGDSEQGALHHVQEAFEHLWRPYKPLWTNCASAPSPEQYRSASWGTEGTSCTSACDHSPCAVTGQLWKKLGSSLGRVSWHNNRSPLQTSFSRLLQGSAEQMFAQAQGWGIKCNIKVKQACS